MENNENVGVDTPVNTQPNTPAMDYEQEYKKMSLEMEKLKNAISKTNSENAEYKRKELASLSDAEKTNLELEQLRKQVASFQLEKDLLSQGYTAQEVAKLVADSCSPKAYAEIMNERIKAQEKALKAEAIKSSTADPILGGGVNSGDNKSSYAEKLAKAQFDDNSSNIKNLYKR